MRMSEDQLKKKRKEKKRKEKKEKERKKVDLPRWVCEISVVRVSSKGNVCIADISVLKIRFDGNRAAKVGHPDERESLDEGIAVLECRRNSLDESKPISRLGEGGGRSE